MNKLNKLITAMALTVTGASCYASNFPDKAMVGYIDTTAIGSANAITPEQIKSYNVIIFGFANSDGTISENTSNLIKKVKASENSGTINLISYGGEYGTFGSNVNEIATNLTKYLGSDVDGIDLDVEDASVTLDTFENFVNTLKEKMASKDSNASLVLAPILAGNNTVPTLNIPGGGVSLNKALGDNTVFDAVLVQAYNSGLGFMYANPETGELINETDANIVQTAYDAIQKRSGISSKIKIVIGIPSNKEGAGGTNLWSNNSAETNAKTILTNTSNIAAGKYSINNSQFGGLMTWSLNTDAAPTMYGGSSTPGFFANNVAKPFLQG